ncbi:hypothetical protein OG21DRAFT_1422363, partial [Imleria badia]
NKGHRALSRYRKYGENRELKRSIEQFERALDICPLDHPCRAAAQSNLALAKLINHRADDAEVSLDVPLSLYRNALAARPFGHADRPSTLIQLAIVHFTRFEKGKNEADVAQAEAFLRETMDHTSAENHEYNLACAFVSRFMRLGDLRDLEQAISRFSHAVDLTPDGHPGKSSRLSDLGTSFFTRFERLGELRDLEQAIRRQRDAVDIAPDGHPHKAVHLDNLGISLKARFERLGELTDLEEAISRYRDAVGCISDGHPQKSRYLDNLVSCIFIRFQRLGDLRDLEQAISRLRDIVDLTPDGHPDKPGHLEHLGGCFLIRFQRLGDLGNLEHAVDLMPNSHPHRCFLLHELGTHLRVRFDRLGELRDLEQAITRFRDALHVTPDGHPDKPCRLSNLGNSYVTRFIRLGEPSDLEEAVSSHRDAVDLTPDGHPHKSVHLYSLGICLTTRFQLFGERSDLEQGISRQRGAVNITPDGHPDKPGHLNGLGVSMRARFELLGELCDLEEAISMHRAAVDLSFDGGPDKPCNLRNLGASYRDRFCRLAEPSDLDQAILYFRNAVDIIPDGHPHKPAYLNDLGNSFLIRFEHVGEPSDLEEAISRQLDAVELTPEGHSEKPLCLQNLADSFKARFDQFGEPSDLARAISLYSQAACDSVGPIINRFHASHKWILCARSQRHQSLLHAYSTAIALLPQLAWIGLPLLRRYSLLVQGADVVREAAAAALDSGCPEAAVEWLEEGRSIVWGELFQLRSTYEELSSVHPVHARRLQELSAALEHVSATHERALSLPSEETPTQSPRHSATQTQSLEQDTEKHRALAIKRDKLLQEIRGLPGFERFLIHKEFSQLRASAHSGPVVILNAAQYRCDALIVLAESENVIHVPLSGFTLKRFGVLQKSLDSLLGSARAILPDDRGGFPASRHDFSWESILSTLWKGVVKPVLDTLGLSVRDVLGGLSRIFWCPTGPFMFLPIHAAGLYGTQYSEPGHKVFDFVISSYVPTLSILMPPIRDPNSSGNIRILAVPQPSSDGQSRLPGVHTELDHIREIISNSPAQTTLLESSIGTVEEVLAMMKDADWVHFACHGVQDSETPSSSGLCLADQRRLKLSDMISLSRPHGGLAFLSACQTATGDKKLSDEAVHIAAGMLFAGYGGVVGTMWSISDRVAPYVAKNVYEELFASGAPPDYREAALALHNAVGRLRDNNASFVEWVPFIHVGL